MGPVPLVSIYILGLQCAEIESKKSGLLAYLEEVGFNIDTHVEQQSEFHETMSILLVFQ